MVDVVFLLIVFFLTTLSLEKLEFLRLDLPQESGEIGPEEVRTPAGIVVNITAAGEIVIEQQTHTLDETIEMIAAEHRRSADRGQPLELLIRPDRSGSLAVVNNLARGLIDRGVSSWRLATDPSAARSASTPGGGS